MNSIVHILSNIDIYIYIKKSYTKYQILLAFWVLSRHKIDRIWLIYVAEIAINDRKKYDLKMSSLNVRTTYYIYYFILKMSFVRNSFFRHVKKDLITKKGI
jgi:hypothetical protein